MDCLGYVGQEIQPFLLQVSGRTLVHICVVISLWKNMEALSWHKKDVGTK